MKKYILILLIFSCTSKPTDPEDNTRIENDSLKEVIHGYSLKINETFEDKEIKIDSLNNVIQILELELSECRNK